MASSGLRSYIALMEKFSGQRPFEPRRRRFRAIPVRMLVPNFITLLALCAGLTAIRLSIEGRMELALGAIVFAAALDGIDGRVARLIKGQSRFGAELDSLADFVNFGVAPAMVFAISDGLRLARFNASLDDPDKPPFAANFFTGVPAPAGAICVLLPLYLAFLGLPVFPAIATAIYTLVIAFLMVSRLPVFSGKTVGRRVPPEMVLPAFVLVVLFIALLIGYPWLVLTTGTLLYLISLPAGALSYRRQQQRYLDARAAAAPAPPPAAPAFQPTPETRTDQPAGERPPHLH